MPFIEDLVLNGLGGLMGGASSAHQAAQARREAERNRQFQERMSSTAHQREVADLRAAGLNPILSAHGGASTPSGSMADVPNIGEGAMAGMASAREARAAREGLLNMRAQRGLTRSQEAKTKEETRRIKHGLPANTFGTDLWGQVIEALRGGPARAQAKSKEKEQVDAVNSAVEANRRRRDLKAREVRAREQVKQRPDRENRPRSGHWSDILPSRRP